MLFAYVIEPSGEYLNKDIEVHIIFASYGLTYLFNLSILT